MKIYLIGDIGGYTNITKKLFNNISKDSSNNDIIILLGDNFYPNGITDISDNKWKNFNDLNINISTYSILGNHDYLGNIESQINYKLNNWNMENNYYKKVIDKFDLFFIDTCILVPDYSNLNYKIVKSKLKKEPLKESKLMLDWLSEELKKSSNIKLVIGHYPMVSFGMYGINKLLFHKLFPIFKENDVKYYISGHDHNLQIIDVTSENYSFKQIISGSGCCTYPILKNISKSIFSKNGYLYINTEDNSLNIIDSNNSNIYKEDI